MGTGPVEVVFGDPVEASESAPDSGDRSFGVPCALATVATARVVRTSGTWTSYNLVPHFYFAKSGWFSGTPVPMGNVDSMEDFSVTTATRFGFTLEAVVGTLPIAQKYVSLVGEPAV